jgi:hypothetical protein
LSSLTAVAADGDGDTIYGIDRISECVLIDLFDSMIAQQDPIVLIAEGLPGGKIVLPSGTAESDAVWRIIADPIDGTRGLMYQKRSAWILTGVAENRGNATSLADIQLAVQTEIPLVKQHLSDSLWAIRGLGARGQRCNRLTGERRSFVPQPSTAVDLTHGFCTVSRFFAGGREILAAIDDDIVLAATRGGRDGKAYAFEDQYLSTGGQLYELMMGHDRFLADLRPLLAPRLQARRLPAGLCCHPYDLCTELIAREAGVLVTNELGHRLHPPLDVEANVSWVGYANRHIKALVEPLLQSALERHGLVASSQAGDGASHRMGQPSAPRKKA